MGVAERPGDWIPDGDAGGATRGYCSHDSEYSSRERLRERPKRRWRRRRSLLSDRNGWAVAVAVITTPHATSHRVAYACARMTQHNERKNITKNRGRRRQEALPPRPSAPPGQHVPTQQDEDGPL